MRLLHALLIVLATALALAASPAEAQTSTFVATLSGSNEVPSLTSRASGSVEAELTGNILTVSGSFADLESDYDASVGSHLHVGFAGQNGGVAFSLTPALDADLRGGTFLAATNTFTLTAEQVAAVEARQVYVNIHTTAHASGELRGQIRPEADATFRAVLSSGTETEPNTSLASGALLAEVRGNTMTVTGAFAELESDLATDIQGGAHIHSGEAGTNGAINFSLTAQVEADARGAVFLAEDNTFTLDAMQMAALEAQGLYVNVHSANHASGELRGQFMAEAGVDFLAQLSGSNEGSAVSSQASGTAVASLEGSTLTVSGSFADLESDLATDVAGGAHIHVGLAGESGSVAFPLTVQAAAGARAGAILAADNTFELSAEQMAALSARGLYVNVHSEGEQSGEIRGQFMAASSTSFTVLLDGDGESPSAETQAEGVLLVEANVSEAIVSGTYDLEGSLATDVAGGAHIHDGETGVNGSILASLDASAGTFAAADNRIALTSDLRAHLESRGLYVNIHSSENASGEIRGQIVPTASVQFEAVLSGNAEVPGNGSGGHGSVLVELNGDAMIVSGAFSNLESDFNADVAGGAHIHGGEMGTNGEVMFGLTAALEADARSGSFAAAQNTFAVTTEQKAMLEAGEFYVNVHTTGQASGELRGQIVTPDVITLEATLFGENETEIVASGGAGFVTATLKADTLVVSGGFTGLQADLATDIAGGAHLHAAGAGENGDVAFALNVQADASLRAGVLMPSQNTFVLTPAQAQGVVAGDFYVNVHSADFASGELRGQLLVATNLEPSQVEVTAPLPSVVIDIDVVGGTAFQADWTDSSDPNGNELTYVWELSAASDFSAVLMAERVSGSSELEVSSEAMAQVLADQGIAQGATGTFFHRVRASDGSRSETSEPQETTMRRGVATDTESSGPVPEHFQLLGNYPNPFNPSTTISFDLPKPADVRVDVFNLLGRRVFTTSSVRLAAGSQLQITLSANDLPSGLYVYRVTARAEGNELVRTGQMTLIK